MNGSKGGYTCLIDETEHFDVARGNRHHKAGRGGNAVHAAIMHIESNNAVETFDADGNG